jgi:hypothetical protein
VSVDLFEASPIIPDVPEHLRIFGNADALSLVESRIRVHVAGVPTPFVNGLRRAATDEILGYALKVPEDGGSDLTTDPYMLPQFVNQRIELLPLNQVAAAKAAAAGRRFELNARNAGATTLVVYASEMREIGPAGGEPLFNQTFELAELQPGKCLVIENIAIAAGRGREHAMFQVATCGAYTHLDIAQHSDDEMRLESGVAADLSGYKESCLVSNPRSHELRFVLQATVAENAKAAATSVLVAAAENIRARLRAVAQAVEGGAAADGPVQYALNALDSGLSEGIVRAPGETHTVGELLRRAIFDLAPDLAYADYSISEHENMLTLRLHVSGDPGAVILEAIKMATAALDEFAQAVTSL